MQHLGWISLRPQSGSWGKNAIGGLIFGLGFALLGYCPGTVAGAIGNGSLDATTAGLAGILLGPGIFATIYPRLKEGILKKGSFGKFTLPQIFKVNNWMTIIPLAVSIVIFLYFLH